MNVEQFHDALGMIPSDLIAETDRLRTAPRRHSVPWKKWVPLAACLALILSSLPVLLYAGRGGAAKDAAAECAPQAPAALYSNEKSEEMAPAAPMEENIRSDTSLSEPAAAAGEIRDLMAEVTAEEAVVLDALDDGAMAAFSVALFQNAAREGENTLLSPLSVLSALAMTGNGALGETRAQMENVMGLRLTELNSYLRNFMDSHTEQLKLANSIWFNSSGALEVEPEFLETNQQYFGADLYEAPMSPETCQAINRWVSEKTDGMIPEILDEIPPDAMMYLVNALAFEARWPEVYLETSVQEGIFTGEDGSEQPVELMCSRENLYIEDALATGFIKPYEDGRYAFVALLPNEGVRVSDYVASLSGEGLQEMLRNPGSATVYAAIPKFETEYAVDMAGVLKSMGMEYAFDSALADFSGIGTCQQGKLYISRVLHKTHLTVAEQGTTAGAATVVEINVGSAFAPDPKEVILNRPFVYMIVDLEAAAPVFLGTQMDMAR